MMGNILRWMLAAAAVVLATACASPNGPAASGQVVDRLPATPKPVVPALPKLTQEDIVRLAKEGMSAEGIISRLKESATRFRLSATDLLSLKARGVPTAVLDHLLDSDRQALLDECSERINRLASEQVQAMQQRDLLWQHRCSMMAPPWPHFYPWPGRRWP
jgi:hypothetical protein